MKCPFLRESWVKFCQAAPYRKVIEQTAESAADLCTSSAFQACAAFREHRKSQSTPPCPFLQESRAQVCSHDPSVRFVPCSDQVHSRCVTDNHRYCESYLAAAHRLPTATSARGDVLNALPPDFFYTRNHMWLDVSAEHDCHIGLDGLLTRLLGRIDRLSFITSQGEQCPSVVLTTHGMNIHLVFPNPMQITCPNAQVRVDPERIQLDPYGAGWLFEGTEAQGTDIRSGLLSGNEARIWMEHELHRITEVLNRRASSDGEHGSRLAADGGVPVEGAIKHLKRNEISHFFDEFFKNEEAM